MQKYDPHQHTTLLILSTGSVPSLGFYSDACYAEDAVAFGKYSNGRLDREVKPIRQLEAFYSLKI